MVEITDREGLEKWLEGQPGEVAVAIAVRAALRVFPLLGELFEKLPEKNHRDAIILSTLRCNLVSAVVSVYLSPEAIGAASAAYAAAASIPAALAIPRAASASESAVAAATSAAHVTSSAVISSSVSDSVPFAAGFAADASARAAGVYAAATATATAFWAAVSEDTGLVPGDGDVDALLAAPLWHDKGIPDAVSSELARFRARLEGGAADWGFWARWYERALSGRWMNWEIQREIALLPDADWKLGAAHIAGVIAEIEARYLVAATPVAERIEVNPGSGLLRVVPVPMENARLYRTALEKVRDTLDDMQPDEVLEQKHMALSKIVKRLDRTLGPYAGNPQRVHDDFLLSAKQIGGLVEAHEIADDEDVDALRSSLITGADDIRAAVDEVRASVVARVQLRIDELRVADTEVIAEAQEVLAEVSEEEMAESSREAAQLLRWPFDELGREERIDVIYRAAAWNSRALLVLEKSIETTGKIGGGLIRGYGATEIILKLKPVQNILFALFG